MFGSMKTRGESRKEKVQVVEKENAATIFEQKQKKGGDGNQLHLK